MKVTLISEEEFGEVRFHVEGKATDVLRRLIPMVNDHMQVTVEESEAVCGFFSFNILCGEVSFPSGTDAGTILAVAQSLWRFIV